MSKKILVVITIAVVFVTIGYILVAKGIISFPTMGENQETPQKVLSVNDLEDGCYYVWHNSSGSDIEDDLQGTVNPDVFRICPAGTINWDKNQEIEHTVWFTASEDEEIPTFYPGDRLVYISPTTVPFEGIEWERFADYGYSIGVANMVGDSSGHYRIILNIENGYEGYLNPESDAAVLEEYTNVSELFLDKIGNVPVRDDLISKGGTVLGLKEGGKYLCEWYTGTYFQDYEMTADNHVFCSMEEFTTYDYDFLHSRAISIIIPEWFKSGYYYIAGSGIFRYVSKEDLSQYNGAAYDAGVNWNDPIILYDERGLVMYDPSSGIDKRSENDNGSDTTMQREESQKQTSATQDANFNSDVLQTDVEVDPSLTDEGADVYEDFYEEHFIE